MLLAKGLEGEMSCLTFGFFHPAEKLQYNVSFLILIQ